MTSGKAMLKSLQAGIDDPRSKLYVTKKHAEWLERPASEQVYTEPAASFVYDALLDKFKHPRGERFSPSSAGGCKRKALFSYAQAPQVGENLDSYDLMGLGTWGHLRWQAEGLSYPYMRECEVWVHSPQLMCGGSIDAVLDDDSLFELKTVAGSRYSKILKDEDAFLEHKLQVELYFALSGADMASIVYEERTSGQFHEFRYRSDPHMKRLALEWVEKLGEYVDADSLPEMLDDCQLRQGTIYRNCPYRKYCPTATGVQTR